MNWTVEFSPEYEDRNFEVGDFDYKKLKKLTYSNCTYLRDTVWYFHTCVNCVWSN
jgi:hypothetical protein